MDVRLIALFLIFVSCMPSGTVSRGEIASTSTTSGSGSGDTTSISAISWNYLGNAAQAISIDSANLNNSYLVGTDLQNYLSTATNFTNVDYCVVANYNLGGVTYELRSRAVPISYYDISARVTKRVLRVDFQDVTNSSSICPGTLYVLNANGSYTVDTAGGLSPVYNPALLCTNCTSALSSVRVRLFQKNSTLQQVNTTQVNLSALALKVDPNINGSSSNGACTTASCAAAGYNCCLDNQCVNDGSTRPSAYTQYASLLTTANQERISNPLAYLRYPQLYYICATAPATSGGTSSGSTTGSTTSGSTGYDAGLVQLKKDFFCLKSIKSQSTTTPYQNELLTRPTPYTASTDCLTASSDSTQTQYYLNVVQRLYQTCGCSQTTLSSMISSCPAYEYSVTTGTEAVPLQIDCYTPPVVNPNTPLQATLNVSSRAAPHRFFDATGTERVLPLSDTSVMQEGDKFQYLDDGNVIPSQSNFSINAILGQINVSLDKAQPAKSISVALDQVYFLYTTSGNYTPCPTCGADSWFSSFYPFPASTSGNGLQARGFTTARDEYGNNGSGGNYEDTIFGRACWIPPTMIPFSQSSRASVQAQRQNRLTTQAALFANGYQRDWYGFNKGALIGSFDGVSWFAIGNGRIVRSTTKKLYLAINAPFADVATNSFQIVNIQAYDGISQASQLDYDPAYHQKDALQNQAGTCQSYHVCSTDTDCITRLGWEYACADVKDTKTQWPAFDSSSNEVAATNVSPTPSIADILAQKSYGSTSTKRCVYRGAGSVCLKNSSALTDLNKKKAVTCAPNFYCASLASGSVFNGRIARYAAALQDIPVSRNHFYGKDANVLGRPLSYLASSESTTLTSSIISTITENMALSLPGFESLASASNTGLCQPGKALPTSLSDQVVMANPFNQQASADPSKRTDYISQIGSCNSVLFTSYRHSSCPVIGTDGNYQAFAAITIPDIAAFAKLASGQNACGLESLATGAPLSSSADTLSTSYSPFRAVEGKTLPSQIITSPTLARDACLRRAGAVCQTNLDCSPNKLHADQVDYFSLSYFGNQAEKTYHTEYLVCGQTDAQPTDPNNTTYDMSLNRCCREVGSDLTTYTADEPTSVVPGNYDAATAGLKLSLPPGTAPNDAKRYSRFATVESIGTSERPSLSAYQERTVAGVLTASPQGGNIMTTNQWKTLNESNSETCCGGGWIRKFSDGGTDWSRRDRLNLDVTNFSCLNSRTALITHPEDMKAAYDNVNPSALVDADYGDYCKGGLNTKGACAQNSFLDSLTDTYPAGSAYPATVVLNTLSPNYSSSNLDNYFTPRSADGNSAVFIDYSNATARRNITIKIPSFVTRSDFDDVFTLSSTLPISLIDSTGGTVPVCTFTNLAAVVTPTDPGACGSGCCFDYDRSSRILKVITNGAYTTQKVGVKITVASAGNIAAVPRTQPGTSSYYLRRLGRLELSGVPQIPFEELYCNDNSNRVVPGIFSAAIITKTQFQSTNFSFSNGGTSHYTSQLGLVNEPVFAANDFKCCAPLGKVVGAVNRCCSGYATVSGTVNTCALPVATDLMVYFNRYISNEGVGADKPGGGLIETDFDSLTGEPLITTTINSKISDLGKAYCSTKKVRQGGAFGSFEPQPQGSDTNLTERIYGILDSSNDIGQSSNAGSTVTSGYAAFMDGFRWNHHLYCSE